MTSVYVAFGSDNIGRRVYPVMTVEGLIAILVQCHPGAVVILSSDGEGNDYRVIGDVGSDWAFIGDSHYSGDILPLSEVSDEELKNGTAAEAVVIWPVG